jgi:hypothetical protein
MRSYRPRRFRGRSLETPQSWWLGNQRYGVGCPWSNTEKQRRWRDRNVIVLSRDAEDIAEHRNAW